uniref:Uncharacterized protein n=1 Tax=Oryza glumipatula TaxID=40148 RepID=A0A0D9Y3I9_9ORYZ
MNSSVMEKERFSRSSAHSWSGRHGTTAAACGSGTAPVRPLSHRIAAALSYSGSVGPDASPSPGLLLLRVRRPRCPREWKRAWERKRERQWHGGETSQAATRERNKSGGSAMDDDGDGRGLRDMRERQSSF